MRIFEGSVLTFLTRFSSAGLSLLAGIITARVLGPDGKGQYTLIILLPTLLIYFGHLGLGASGVYFMGKKKYTATEITSNLVVCTVGIGGILVLVGLIGIYGFNPTFLQDVSKAQLALAVVVTPVLLLHTYFMWVFLGKERIREYNLLDIARPFGLVIGLFLLTVVVRAGVLGATVAYVMATIAACILGVFILGRAVDIGWRFNRRLVSDLLRFGLKNHLGGVAQFLNYRLSLILASHFLAVKSVGHYSISIAVAETLWYIPNAVALVLLPRISSEVAARANILTPTFCRSVLLATIVLSIAYALLGRIAVPLVFGKAFLPSIKPLLLLLPGVALFSISKVLSTDFIGRGRPELNAYIAFASLALMLMLSVVLIPRLGLSGAALASSASYCASSVIGLFVFWKITGVSPPSLLLPRFADLQLCRDSMRRMVSTVNWRRALQRLYGNSLE